MKVSAIVCLLVGSASAFTSTSIVRPSTSLFGYVPDGLSAEEWKKIQAKEREQKKNLGKLGPRGFKSRSFQSFQEALERGETTHLMPVLNARERVRKGELKVEDIPYMQRGGSWDNSDVKGARKVRWLQSDKEYASGGYKKEQSVSILGTGAGLDWTGKGPRRGPGEQVMGRSIPKPRGYKAPNVNVLQKGLDNEEKSKKKGPFGLW